MVLSANNSKGQRGKKEAEHSMQKAGKKRGMPESEEEDEEDDDDEIDLEALKSFSKKIKHNSNDESEDDEEESDDEDDASEEDESEGDDEGDEDFEEDEGESEEEDDEEEEKKPVAKKAQTPNKATPKKPTVVAPTPSKATNNGLVQQKQETMEVNNNAVLICNLNRQTIKDSLESFIASKSGVTNIECFVSLKPSAIITTQNKQDAEKILKSCQSVLYQGNQLQVSTIASGCVSKPRQSFSKKAAAEIEPSKAMIVYSLVGKIEVGDVSKLCPKAINCNRGKSGVYCEFETPEDCKQSFLEIGNMTSLAGMKPMVKYVRNASGSADFSGSETRLNIFGLPGSVTKQAVEELVPKATFVHFNPCAFGGYLVDFATPKDCKEAGERLTNYQMGGRTLRVIYSNSDLWEIKLIARTHLNDARMHLQKHFPEMQNFFTMTVTDHQKRKPAFVLTFKNREIWLRAISKASTLKSVAGVQMYLVNSGKMVNSSDSSQKKGNKTLKKKPQSSEEEEEDDEEDEPMDEDEEDSDEEEEEKPQKKSPIRGKGKQNGKFGGNQQRGNANRGGRGNGKRGRPRLIR